MPLFSKEVNENKFCISKFQDPKCVSAKIDKKIRENNQLLKRRMRNGDASNGDTQNNEYVKTRTRDREKAAAR